MSRHLADHRAKSDGGRLKAFYLIEKTGGEDGATHATSLALHQRPATRTVTGRVENYLRIERGHHGLTCKGAPSAPPALAKGSGVRPGPAFRIRWPRA